MRKFIFVLSFSILLLTNAIAGDAMNKFVQKRKDIVNAENAGNSAIAKGAAIFNAKGCSLCHKAKKEIIGPSLYKIAKAYTDKSGTLIPYLSSQGTPIVYPDRASVMNPQLAKIKTLSEEKMKALATYIISAADRKN